jgi:hypothetical protein
MTGPFSFNPDNFKDAPEEWRGAWPWGVDFGGDSNRVVAVHAGGSGECKYGYAWIGPIDLSVDGNSAKLEHWAESTLSNFGGYIHLLPAEGDAQAELDESDADFEERKEWRKAYHKEDDND